MNCIICNSKEAAIYKCYECNGYLFCISCFNSNGSVRSRDEFLIPHYNNNHNSVDIA